METATIILLGIVITVVLPTLVALGSAIFKLGRDLKKYTSKASEGGKKITATEVDGLIDDINVIGKTFSKLSEQLVKLWNKIF